MSFISMLGKSPTKLKAKSPKWSFTVLMGMFYFKLNKQKLSVIGKCSKVRVRTRIFFSFATIFANLIFFVPFSLTLSQILCQILAVYRQGD